VPDGDEATLRPPAAAFLVESLLGFALSRAIVVAVKLGIADLLADGPRTTRELAARAGADEQALYRLLRTLASYGIFSEPAPGRFALNDVAELLRADAERSLRDLVLYYGGVPQQAWGEALYSVQTGGSAFERVFGTSIWEYFASHPDDAAIFNGAMRGGATDRAAALRAYPWKGDETVIDVGGGNGALLIDLLSHHAGLNGVVVDLPHVAVEATERIAAAALERRCRAVAGDLFSDVPGDGDAYVLAIVLHDWDDDPAAAILETCRKAMNPDAVLLLIEMVLAADAKSDIGKIIDLHMLVETGGRERTEPEWQGLLERSGFRLSRIFPGWPWALIEAVPA
jgi:hypothetical protein